MVEQTRTEFIGFSSTIEKEGREGNIQVFTHVQGMPITDEELAGLRRLQEEAAARVDEMMNGKQCSIKNAPEEPGQGHYSIL